jgi:hypothetical protein
VLGLALEVADGAVRKMSVVPDANGRDHRREEEQSDERRQHKRPFSEALAPTTQFVRNALILPERKRRSK